MKSEMFSNIKMVKLYSWTDVILSIINKRRNKELLVFKKEKVCSKFSASWILSLSWIIVDTKSCFVCGFRKLY